MIIYFLSFVPYWIMAVLEVVTFYTDGQREVISIKYATLQQIIYTFTCQLTAFAFIYFKPVEDCFACFNRLGQTRTYSIFQYPIKEHWSRLDNYQKMIREQVQGDINLDKKELAEITAEKLQYKI